MDLERALLALAADDDRRIGSCNHYLFQRLQSEFPDLGRLPLSRRWQAIWTLIARGLAYVDFSKGNWDNATLELTDSGRAVVSDPEFNPDTGSAYVRQVRASVPDASATVLQYVTEAHRAYEARCFFATAVMVGVASEAAFLEMAPSFASWLPPGEQVRFRQVFDSPRVMYLEKFKEFRTRIDGKTPQLPPDLADGLDLTLSAVLDALRVYRNQAGHPTGKQIDRGTAFTILQMVPRYLQRMYDIKVFFDQANAAAAGLSAGTPTAAITAAST